VHTPSSPPFCRVIRRRPFPFRRRSKCLSSLPGPTSTTAPGPRLFLHTMRRDLFWQRDRPPPFFCSDEVAGTFHAGGGGQENRRQASFFPRVDAAGFPPPNHERPPPLLRGRICIVFFFFMDTYRMYSGRDTWDGVCQPFFFLPPCGAFIEKKPPSLFWIR